MCTFAKLRRTAFYGAFLISCATLAFAQVAPVPEALTLTPVSVDVTASNQTVQLTLRVKYWMSDDVEIGFSYLGFYVPSGLSSIQATAVGSAPAVCSVPIAGYVCANFTYTLTVPQGTSPSGTYSPYLSLGWYRASAWNYSYYDPTAFLGLGITTTLTITLGPGPSPSCTLPPLGPGIGSGGLSDTTPPSLVGLCLSSYTIDVTSAPQTVNFFLNVTDDLSGFQWGDIYLYSPSGNQSQYVEVNDWNRIQGNGLSGIYEVPVTIPLSAEAGDWTIAVELVDNVNNSNWIQPAGTPSTFTVVSVPDTTPPVWNGITFTPASVNVSAAPQTVTFNVSLSDDRSGVDVTSDRSYFDLTSPSGKQSIGVGFYSGYLTQISGTLNNGVWQGQVTIPRYSEPGAWKLGYVDLYDLAGNQLYLAPGWSTMPAINLTVASSPYDVTPPSINSFSFSPSFVNTAGSDQTVDLTLTVTDNLSGLYSYGPGPNGLPWVDCYAYFYSPSGRQYQYSSGMWLASGTATNGVVNGTLTMPRYSEMGTWSLNSLSCMDNANNWLQMSTADALAKHFPVSLIVIQPSETPDGTVGSAGGTVQDTGSATTLTFPPGAVSANTTVAIDVLSEPPAVSPPIGFTVGTGFVNIDLNPKPTGPIPAPGLTLVLPLDSSGTPGTSLMLYRIDPVSGALTPAIAVGGGPVTGTVGASGLSATFTGIASFSTVVGLYPPTIPGDLNGDGVVNCQDILIIRNSWGKRSTQEGFDSRADYNRDGVVNVFDLAAVSKYLARGAKCK
jgi:hypothetical protein